MNIQIFGSSKSFDSKKAERWFKDKAARELGSERRETVRSLSIVGAGYMRGAVPSTRGPEWTYLWCNCCRANGIAGKRSTDGINAEGI